MPYTLHKLPNSGTGVKVRFVCSTPDIYCLCILYTMNMQSSAETDTQSALVLFSVAVYLFTVDRDS